MLSDHGYTVGLMSEQKNSHVSILLTPSDREKLKARADENGRSLSGEARFIIANELKEVQE